MRPLIGLTTYREQAKWGVWDQPADLLPVMYADAIVRAGGVPVLLPPATDDPDAAASVVARIDGLVVSGGADVDPQQYGEEPHPRTASWRPDRDAWELALLTSAAAANLPTLGVCRGMQVMAVAAGGTLDQHTPDVVGHEEHSPGGDVFGEVEVSTAESSVLRSILGPGTTVHCHHHQSVRSHPGFDAVAHAEDGTLEAMETPGERFCVAVQWHPEIGRDQRLFDALVRAASG
ncbi:gamma-glutamyl-gamma-aminobutyrate hydrolase family protein [Marmoricola sp. URHB0036]|jgi:putative glutamine amidotransferase|uniref:gamma-glutamyl-gamma-aminobutyrate hydrolase family protein n=1 Tax=Marmoricola sp. URHB0036 TaxID=1298863 RepID=UPI0003F66E15|nr:gamma-glutamyl-gamma-aminobutyrate hydrolase family protein [Marmoricola sp. URHB0036]